MESLLEALNNPELQHGGMSPQFALLNFFFPGFSVFQSALYTYLGIDLNFYIPLLVAIFGMNFLWTYISGQVWALVGEYLMSSFRVRTDDEIYNMLMLWITRQKFSQNSRNFLVNTDIYSRSNNVYSPGDSDDEDEDSDDEKDAVATADGAMILGGKQNLHFTPSFGSHRFWYKGWPLMFERLQNSQQINFQSASEREELSISCYGRNPQILKDILQEARQMYLKKDERKTLIFRGTGSSYGDPYWQRTMTRPNRPFSTIVMDENLKQSLIDDIADYIHPATRRWYSNRGIPYRRGYLLHGPPGTGKSSISLSLAGYFRMAIYIVSLSSLSATEEGLTSLFNMLPTRCLVLLEDIDTAGLTHTRDQPDPAPEAGAPHPFSAGQTTGSNNNYNNNSGTSRLSLSGLLNILDGVASKEGRILVMTTNHIEKLDKALIRPGRVDMLVPFRLANQSMTQAIFRAIYAPYEGELTAPVEEAKTSKQDKKKRRDPGKSQSSVIVSWEKEQAEILERIARLAAEFAARIPELEFSPAEIQGLLLRHKRSPEDAVEAAEEWVKQTRKEKKEKEQREAEERRKQEEENAKKEKQEKEAKEEKERKRAEEAEGKKSEEAEMKSGKTKEKAEETKPVADMADASVAVCEEGAKEGRAAGEGAEGEKEASVGEEGKSDTQDEEKKAKSASDSDYEKV